MRKGDDRGGTRTAGAVPGTRSGRSRAGEQDLVSKHRAQPIRIEENEVVAMAVCVTAGPGASPGDNRNNGDEVNGLVERAAPHLIEKEGQQLLTATAARRHLFATGKGALGRTNIVKHQIHTGDQPAIKQRV